MCVCVSQYSSKAFIKMHQVTTTIHNCTTGVRSAYSVQYLYKMSSSKNSNFEFYIKKLMMYYRLTAFAPACSLIHCLADFCFLQLQVCTNANVNHNVLYL